MDTWIICWKVNLLFHSKHASLHNCILCGSVVEGGLYLSTFVNDAVSCGQRHRWKSFGKEAWHSQKCVCAKCDEELVMNITLRKQKCFAEGCESILNIDEAAIREKVEDKELLEKYLLNGEPEFVQQYLTLLREHRVFTCVICYCVEPLHDASPPTAKCQHDANTCKDCLGDLLRSAVDNGQWREIKCPDTSCKQVLSGLDVQTFASREVFQKYEGLVTMKNLSSLPDFRWCAGNNHKCGSGQIIAIEDDGPKWQCKKCKLYNCFNCLSLHHERQTCIEYRRDAEVDSETLALIYTTTKMCPNRECKKRITKNKRCKDMECDKDAGGCGLTFCWNCKIIYPLGVSSHLASCIFAGRITVPQPSDTDMLYAPGWNKDPNYIPARDEYKM